MLLSMDHIDHICSTGTSASSKGTVAMTVRAQAITGTGSQGSRDGRRQADNGRLHTQGTFMLRR